MTGITLNSPQEALNHMRRTRILDRGLSTIIPIEGYTCHVTSYGEVTRSFAQGLTQLETRYEIVNVLGSPDLDFEIPEIGNHHNKHSPESWRVSFSTPDYCHKDRTLDRVAYTMWESTRLHTDWVEELNRRKLVIVPSTYCADMFSANGINKARIAIVPLGVDTRLYRYVPKAFREKVVFGAGGNLAHGLGRKRLDIAIKCFQEAFEGRENVELQVKVTSGCKIEDVNDDRITFIRGYVSEEEMAAWYQSLDVFISASRSEGWGWMPQKAMCCGTPVVSSIYGGVREFMSYENSYEVAHQLVAAKGFYARKGHWGQLDVEGFKAQMIRAASNPNERWTKGKLAHTSASRFTWKNSAAKLVEVLNDQGYTQL